MKIMPKFAVIKTGGKQYLVKKDDEIVIDRVGADKSASIKFDTLAILDTDKNTVDIGAPFLVKKVNGTVVDHVKGDKVRVAKFKAKVRYRKVMGFRQRLTKIKIQNV